MPAQGQQLMAAAPSSSALHPSLLQLLSIMAGNLWSRRSLCCARTAPSARSPGPAGVTGGGLALQKVVVTLSGYQRHLVSSLGVTGLSEEERSW